ncbi:MAG: hypothetical protein ACI9LM_001674 [Alteromonadaceae bacterium]|jgi:uncharacterized protein (DUF58 family)
MVIIMIKKSLNRLLQKRFNHWLTRRIPAANTQRLSNRNIFILPSRFGLCYLLFVLILFLLGTNYQNNVIILLSYVFASVFISAMLQSFFNLSGLTFKCQPQSCGYAKQLISISLTIDSEKKRHSLSFQFPQQTRYLQKSLAIGRTELNLGYCPEKRGVNNPGRLRISSEYALGLFTCWTQLDFGCEVITYPEQGLFQNLAIAKVNHQDDEHGVNIIDNGDDFGELRQYRAGESLSQVAWKQLARGQGWLTKTTQEQQGSDVWLTLHDLPAVDIEIKLQMICYLMLDQSQQGKNWGIDLGREKLSPSSGKKHLTACLKMLAHYPHKQVLNEQ